MHPTTVQPETWVVAGGRPSLIGEPLNTPLIAASNFALGGGPAYARDDGTPTWDAFEVLVGGLESATAISFASGMAAIAAVFDLLPVGAHVVWPDDCYQAVAGLVSTGETAGRLTSTRLSVADTDAWCRAAEHCDLMWIESPSNPLLTVADLATLGDADRRPGSMLVVDNSLAGPLAQRPLDVGADIAVQSATKHIGGHSDLLCGVATTRSDRLATRLREQRELRGATPGVLETYLAARGIRTLALRHDASQRSAGELAERLEGHAGVTRVRYPGLRTHPTHSIAAAQLKGFGTVISFDVAGGAEPADEICRRIQLIRHATSFGAVESTLERRAAVPGQEHLPPGLLRLSVGIEHVDDIWNDLSQALATLNRPQ